MTTKLSDIQLVLLASAAQREDGSLLPLPDSIGQQGGRIRRSVTALLRRGLAEEFAVRDPLQTWRDDAGQRIGVRITADGRAAIGLDHPSVEVEVLTVAKDEAETARPRSKRALVVGLIERNGGASIDELTSATGWLPHTMRAALTGLRKNGHAVVSERVDGLTRYSIRAAG